MKTMRFCLLSLVLPLLSLAQLQPLFLSPELWEAQTNPLQGWEFARDSISNPFNCGLLPYTVAPISDHCVIEAVVTPKANLAAGKGWGVIGIALYAAPDHFWHVALVESPQPANKHHIEMHQNYQGRWTYSNNVHELEISGRDYDWQYNTPYRLRLELVGDIVSASVHTLDGQQCFTRKIRYRDGEKPIAARPALRGLSISGQFRDIKAQWGKALPEPVVAEAPQAFPPYASDSFIADIRRPATGFFHTWQNSDGRWWLIDPLGRGFVLLGCGTVTYEGPECESRGCFPYAEHNKKAFASRQEWSDQTLDRLKAWGFNTIGGGSPELFMRGLPHTAYISIGGNMAALGDEFDITPHEGRPCSAFPNVFHPRFQQWCDYRAEQACRRNINNPWLIGYYLDNELAWWGRGKPHSGLFDAVMKKNARHSAKMALRDFLRDKSFNDIVVFNKQWQQDLKDFNDILRLHALPENTPEQTQLKTDFLAIIAERYFRSAHDAFRKVDKNHMLMGCRAAGIRNTHEVVWRIAGKYNDCLTWNMYGKVDLDEEAAYIGFHRPEPLSDAFKTVYDWIQKPVIITEWSFPALDSGLPCTHGAGQRFRTQTERSRASEIYARTLLSMPFMLGYVYFMWVDEPAEGVRATHPENTNYGLVRANNEPYEELVATFTALHRDPRALRLASIPQPKPRPDTSRGAVYRRYAQGLPTFTQSAPHPQFRRQLSADKSFSVSNGRLSISRQANQPFLDVTLDGQPMGRFGTMLHYLHDGTRQVWADTTAIDDVAISANADMLLISVKARKEGPAKELAEDQRPFTMDYRIILLPDCDWFLSEITAAGNADSARALELRGMHFRLFPAFSALELPGHSVPNLWNRELYSGWLEDQGRRYVAAAGNGRQDLGIRFWISKNDGVLHPDSFRKFTVTLAPNESYQPETPFYIFNLFGNGDHGAMREQVLKIIALDQQ